VYAVVKVWNTDMVLPSRKYMSEHALNLHTKNTAMLPPDQITSGPTPSPEQVMFFSDMHIYVICVRKELRFVPNSLVRQDNRLSGQFEVHSKGLISKIPFEIPAGYPAELQAVVSDFPYRMIEIIDSNSEVVRFFSNFAVAILSGISLQPEYSYEVVYVGQAYGNGNRSAFDRLKKHETLQKILADIVANDPSQEPMVFLFQYEPATLITSINPFISPQVSDEEDTAHTVHLLNNPPTEKECVSIAESALINYFQPKYNKIYRGNYPSERLKILKSCYDLDFAALTVEMNIEDLHCRVHSEQRGHGQHHMAAFDLHDPKTRSSFFSLTGDEVGLDEEFSGPIF